LCIEAVSSDFAPYQLLALLKHPLTECDLQVINYIENQVLRGQNIKGLDAIQNYITKHNETSSEQTKKTLNYLDSIISASSKLQDLFTKDAVELKDILVAHIEFSEAISYKGENGELTLWSKDDGNSAAMFISDMIENSDVCGEIDPSSYAGILTALMSGIVVRPKYGSHPRISILGNMEARLLHTDLVIVGSANEGIWPSHASADAWMSRPMRKEFGLPLPEKRIGLAAHDFAQAFCAPNVIITRSEKTAGTPSVPSRWLMRLDAVLELSGLSLKESTTNDENLSHHSLAEVLDYAERNNILMPPAPCPPVSARPREISATQVEKWMRDPYSIYAKYILKLEKLEEIVSEIEAKDYGNIIHDALEEFVKMHPTDITENGFEELLQIGMAKFDELDIEPEIYEFWKAKFTNIASWFINEESSRQPNVKKRNAEIWGNMTISADAGDFKIKAKADRVDEMRDGTLEIIDYKTGKIPSRKEVAAGYSPQLPLEAAIAKSGGFQDANGTDVEKISYWSLKGDGSNKISSAIDNKHNIDDIIDDAINGVSALINVFDREETPYEATPHPGKAAEYSDYKHLSRQDEWMDKE
jgi:ATP-dependent helicase/nuclease subunit B